jgi:hypothetical protein
VVNGSAHENWIDPICTIARDKQRAVHRFIESLSKRRALPGYATWNVVADELASTLGIPGQERFDRDEFDQDVIATLRAAVDRGRIVRLVIGGSEQFKLAPHPEPSNES